MRLSCSQHRDSPDTSIRHDDRLIHFLGFPIHTYTLEETISLILNNIKRAQTTHHVAVNAAKIVYARRQRLLSKSIQNSDIISPDGQSIVWGARFLGYEVPERVTGVDLFFCLLTEFEKHAVPVYFLGATDEVLGPMLDRVRGKHPHLQIAGYRNGYFSTDEEERVCQSINDSGAQALFLGISTPKKEIFLLKHKSHLKPCFLMGVGGSFDIIAGYTKRAPKLMQQMGLEWLYRIFQEPRRMWKRYAITNTLFLYYLISEKLKHNPQVHRRS